MAVLLLSNKISPLTYAPAYAPFKPNNPDNARILRITAAAGTELADAYSHGTVKPISRISCSSRIKAVYNP